MLRFFLFGCFISFVVVFFLSSSSPNFRFDGRTDGRLGTYQSRAQWLLMFSPGCESSLASFRSWRSQKLRRGSRIDNLSPFLFIHTQRYIDKKWMYISLDIQPKWSTCIIGVEPSIIGRVRYRHGRPTNGHGQIWARPFVHACSCLFNGPVSPAHLGLRPSARSLA